MSSATRLIEFLRSALVAFTLTAVVTQVGYALPVALQSCSVPGVKRSARCGVIEVPENPDQSGSRKLEIHFAVIPARNGHAVPDPIVPLLGGPGEAATEAGKFLERLTPMLDDRDLLLVDQRGTGQSGGGWVTGRYRSKSLAFLLSALRAEVQPLR